MIIIVL